jgi:D-psicose/D-tagatose/L-ribulose 3-epimerase
MAVSFHFAVCNEIFQQVPFEHACRQVKTLGYEGLELAPFTLSEDPAALSPADRDRLHGVISEASLKFVGLHWLLAAPPGLHATARDESVRKHTWNYVHQLIDLCADLADPDSEDKGVLVFGSPKQRSAVDGMTPREATDVLTHELAHAAPHAESRGVKILIEALSPEQTNVINNLADAVSIVKQIGSPAVQTMFDAHNAVAEQDPHPELVRKYAAYIHHVHVNEMDGREPGSGDYDFKVLLAALADVNYAGWISVEAFNSGREANEVASGAIHHLQAALPGARAASRAI